MPQVTIYIPEDLLEEVKAQAQAANLSLSGYFANLARRTVRPRTWPESFFDLAGSCSLEPAEDLPLEPVDPW